MFLVYTLSIGTIGDWTVNFMNDTLFGEWIVPGVTTFLENIGCADWLVSLIADGDARHLYAQFGFQSVMPASIGMAQWIGGKPPRSPLAPA